MSSAPKMRHNIIFSNTAGQFLQERPEVVAEMPKSSGYTKNKPRTITEAKETQKQSP